MADALEAHVIKGALQAGNTNKMERIEEPTVFN